MATLIKVDGTKEEVQPEKGKHFGLEQLYALLECEMIEIVNLPDGTMLVIDEEGKLHEPPKPRNDAATLLFVNGMPGDYIAGPALHCGQREIN